MSAAPARTRDGRELFVLTRAEVEAAPGWRATHGGRKGRGGCVMHGGDNREAMEADFATGWVRCFTRGCLGRLADHPETRVGGGGAAPPQPRDPEGLRTSSPALTAGKVVSYEKLAPVPPPDADRLADLRTALARAAAALPDSAGEAYLSARGVQPVWPRGWGSAGARRGRWPAASSFP